MTLVMMYAPRTGLNVIVDAVSCVVTFTALGTDWLMAASTSDMSESLTLVALEGGSIKRFPW